MGNEARLSLGSLRDVPPLYRRRGYRHTASWAFYGAFIATVAGQGPFVIRELGGSALQCLSVNLAQALPLVFALLWMPLVERRNPARLTGLLMLLGGVLTALSGLTRDRQSLVLVLSAGMVLSTVSQPSLGITLRQVYPDRWRGTVMSLPETAATLARIVALASVGWLLRRDIGLHRVAFSAAGVCLVLCGLLFRGIGGSRGAGSAATERAPAALERIRSSVRGMFRNRPLLVFLTGYFITACGAMAVVNALPLFARDELGLTTAQWGYANAGFMVAMFLSLYLWGVFMDRFGAPMTVVLSWGLQCGMLGALFVVKSWPAFFVIVSVRGFFQAGNALAFLPMVMHFTPSSETGRGMALHFSMWGVRWVAMALLVVWVVDGALFPTRYIFLGGTVLVALGIAVMAPVCRRPGTGAEAH
jgi:MFS family permease